VDDMVDALMRMMATGDDVTGPINVGNPREFSMLQLAEMVVKQTGSKSRIERRPLPSDDPKQRRPDITLAKDKLRWEPTTQLEAGLERTIAYFRDGGADRK
jgi:UDP-glucuronate decarboxylase